MQLHKIQGEISRQMAILEDKILSVYKAERDLDRKSKKLMMNFKKLFAIEFMKIIQRKKLENEAKK